MDRPKRRLAAGSIPLTHDGPHQETRWRTVIHLRNLLIGSGPATRRPNSATYAGWMEPEFSQIDWNTAREEIHNQVRAIRFGGSGRSGPVAMVADRRLRVLRTSLQPADGIKMMCGDGPVWITESVPVVDSDS